MGEPLRFSIVIVSLNGCARIAMPLDALRKCVPAPAEVILVDNGSTDGLSPFVRKNYPEVRLVRAPRNLGFGGGNNLGILNASGGIVVLLNDDTEPDPGWLAPLERAFREDPKLGCAGCRLLYPGTRKVQHLGGFVHANGLTDHAHWGEDAAATEGLPVREVDYATGAAMAVRRECLAQTGLLDECFWPIYFEEVDWCARARRRGWRVAVVPESTVVHHESQTTERFSPRFLRMYHRNRIRFLLKNRAAREWPGVIRAEARWLAGHAPWDSLWACSLAYAWGAAQCVEILAREARGERF
ncbi:MAG: glycosyltransferase family 2 protein [Candidatus Sumerlaeia bacterium]|nr:glycosyltransferase family 2 protein [Candidatus Sumerlaeia bacterium]